MSKFFPDLPDTFELPPPMKPKPLTAAKQRARLNLSKLNRGCEDCPRKALWPTLASPCMKISGDTKPEVLILGTAPNRDEDREDEQFKSEAGKIIRNLIPSRMRDYVAYQNAVRCYGPDDPTTEVLQSCSIHTETEIPKSVKVIIGVGQAPLSLYYPGAQVWRIYGTKFVARLGERLVWYYPVMDPQPMLWKAKQQDKKVEWLPDYAVLRADINKVFKEYNKWPAPHVVDFNEFEVITPDTPEEAKALIRKMKQPLGFDLETSTLVPYVKNAKILSASFSDGETTVAFPIDHPQAGKQWSKAGLQLVLWVLRNREWLAHNAAMELKWAAFFGPGMQFQAFDDSMALGRLYHEREHGLSLANLTRIHLGTDIKTLCDLDVKRLDSYPLDLVLKYNGLDALGCRMVYDKLFDVVVSKQEVGYRRLLDACSSTVHMELVGLPVDLKQAQLFDAEWTAIINTAASKIRTLYEVKQYERNTGKEFNPSSPKQFGEALSLYGGVKLPRSPKTGAYVADEDTLNLLCADHPLVQNVLAHRGALKMKSTYIDPVILVPVMYPDGLIHPGYTTMHTATLRLSGEDPNIQNYPKRKHREIRRMIVPGDGHIMVAIDEGQLEVRVLAMASKDPVLIDFIISGKDMHSYWLDKALDAYPDYIEKLAYRTNETDEKKIRKGGRDTIKTDFVFASFYGSGPKSVAARTDIPISIVMELLEEFWQMFRGVKEWQKARRREYDETGGVKTLTGRMRHDILGGNEPYNTPIQGTGSDLVIDAQNELYFASVDEEDPYLAPRINIHDDLTFIWPDNEEDIQYYTKRAQHAMTRVRYPWQYVPLMIEAKKGYNWADMTEFHTYTGKYVK